MAVPYGAGYSPPLPDGVWPQSDNVPPRVGIGVSVPGATQAVVTRTDDGGEVAVHGANPLLLDAQGNGQVYDYASQFGVATTYTVVTTP